MKPFQQRLYALGESDDITVVAAQDNILAFMRYPDNIDSSNGTCLRTDIVEKADDLLFVRNGHVQSLELRVHIDDLREAVNARQLEVQILGINILILKFLIEEVL